MTTGASNPNRTPPTTTDEGTHDEADPITQATALLTAALRRPGDPVDGGAVLCEVITSVPV